MGEPTVSVNVGLGEFPEASGTFFAGWWQHEVLSLLLVVALGSRHPCGGCRRDDHLFLGASYGGAGADCAVRRRFGSAWRRRCGPEVAGEGADTRARAFRPAPTRSGS